MLIFFNLLLLLLDSCLSSSLDNDDFLNTIEHLNLEFVKNGPSLLVLETYETFVNKIEKKYFTYDGENLLKLSENNGLDKLVTEKLPFIYFKKSLIERKLNKENNAIESLKKCISLNPSINNARQNLAQIYLSKGQINQAKNHLNKNTDSDLLKKISDWEIYYLKAEKYYQDKNYSDCIKVLDQYVLPLSSSHFASINLHFKCSKNEFKNFLNYKKLDVSFINKKVINDLNKLIKLNPLNSLEKYSNNAEFLLFTELNYDLSNSFVRSCLRMDNEFKPCIQFSMFLNKFRFLFQSLVTYSAIVTHTFSSEETLEANYEDKLKSQIDLRAIRTFLFDDLVSIPSSDKQAQSLNFNNNLEYLNYKIESFVKNYTNNTSSVNLLKFHIEFNKFVCETLILTRNNNKAKSFCVNVKSDSFFPKHIFEIDNLIKKKNYNEARNLMNQFKTVYKNSKLFKERENKLNENDQHNYHRNQYSWFNTGHGNEYNQPKKKPLKDYYKILDIPKTDDEQIIKKLYKKLILKYHPDKYKDKDLSPEELQKKIQEINEAYEVLSKKDLKRKYDNGIDVNDPNAEAYSNFNEGSNFGFSMHSDFGDDFFKNFFDESDRNSHFFDEGFRFSRF